MSVHQTQPSYKQTYIHTYSHHRRLNNQPLLPLSKSIMNLIEQNFVINYYLYCYVIDLEQININCKEQLERLV